MLGLKSIQCLSLKWGMREVTQSVVWRSGDHEDSQPSNFESESLDLFVKNANVGALSQILKSEDIA